MYFKFLDVGKENLKISRNIELKNLKKNPELFYFGKVAKNHVLFSPLLQRIYLMDEEVRNTLNKPKIVENEINEFIKAGIFIENPEKFFPITPIQRGVESLNTMTIFLTTNCNLRCKYCYASGGENPYNIDFNFVKKALNYLNGQNYNISFHGGGEPFQAFDLMKKIADYARMKFKKVSLGVSTNGMLTNEKIDWIIDNYNVINLSADGPPIIQNMQRPLAGNKPSGVWLEKVLKTFDEQGWSGKIWIRSTISSFSVKKTEEIVDYFHKFGISNLHFEPLFETGRAIKTKISAPKMDDYVNYYLAALELAERYGMNLKSTFLPIEKKVTFCGAAGSNFSLTTDGFVSACHEAPCGAAGPKLFIYGKYDKKKKKILINQRRLNFLKTRTVYEMNSCQKCIAKWGCAGGCLIKCFWKTGSIFKPYKEYCSAMKKILKGYIKYRAEKDIIKIKPHIKKSGKNYFYISFFGKGRMDVIKNEGDEFNQSKAFVDISSSKTDFNKLLKNILINKPYLFLSFNLKKEDINLSTGKKIEMFLEELKKNKIDFKINKPLPKCLFGIEHGKIVKKFNAPINCENCFELFELDEKGNIIFCNRRDDKKINLNRIKDRSDIIQIFNMGRRKISDPCDSCIHHLRKSCNGLCF